MEATTMTGNPRHFGAGPATPGRLAIVQVKSRLYPAIASGDGQRVLFAPYDVRRYGLPLSLTLDEFLARCCIGAAWWNDTRPGLFDPLNREVSNV